MSDNFLIKNEILALRFIETEDFDDFYYLQTDTEINHYIRVGISDDEVQERFDVLSKPWDEREKVFHGFVINLNHEEKMQGIIWYQVFDKKHQIIEIGWKIHPDAKGQGIATRAAKLAMTYLTKHYTIHKFIARCDSENVASERIMQKLGMHPEANLKKNFKIGDDWRDEIRYGLIVS